MMNTVEVTSQQIRRAFAIVLCTVFTLSFLKGFRLPNLWAATHFSFNYGQGFVRRGLVGEVARQIGGTGALKYGVVVTVAGIVFAAVAFALGRRIFRVLRLNSEDAELRIALLVFAASPGLVMFIHMIGYNDYYGLLAALLLLAGLSTSSRIYPFLFAASVIGVLFIFIHEALVVMFFPAIVFCLVCHALKRHETRALRRRDGVLWGALLISLTVSLLILSVVVSRLGSADVERIRRLQQFVQEHADFGIREDAFIALSYSSEDAIHSKIPAWWAIKSVRLLTYSNWAAIGPSFLFLLYYGVRSLRALQVSLSMRVLLGCLFVGASVAPLALCFVGWDWNRWNGIALLSCGLCILAMKQFFPSSGGGFAISRTGTLGIVVAVVSLASTTELYDRFEVQYFPFDEQWQFLHDWVKGDFTYRPHS